MNTTIKLLLFIIVFGAFSAQSQLLKEWAHPIAGVGDGKCKQVATDNFGNVYTIGYFNGTIDLDPGTGTNYANTQGSNDFFIQKLDPNGNLVWAHSFGDSNSDVAYAMAIDGNGDIYLTGWFQGTIDFDPGPGTANITAGGGNDDIFILKLDANGNFIWAKAIGGSHHDQAYDINIDQIGYVNIGGMFSTTVDFNPGSAVTSKTSVGGFDGFVLRLDPNGNYIWANTYGSTGDDRILGVSSNNNSVVASGFFRGTITVDPSNSTTLTAQGAFADGFVIKMLNNSTYDWSYAVSSTGENVTSSVTVDNQNDVLITGYFNQTVDFLPSSSAGVVTSNGQKDIYVVKLNNAGVPQWYATAGGDFDDNPSEIRTDGNDNVLTTGYISSSSTPIDFDPQFGSYDIVPDQVDCFIWNLKPDGTINYANHFGGPNDQFGESIAVTASNEVYTCGEFYNQINFNFDASGSSISGIGLTDGFIHKSNSCVTSSVITPTACNSYMSPSGKTFTTTGVYEDTLSNQYGCDSLILVDLTIISVDTLVSQSNHTLSVTNPAMGDTYQWMDCDAGVIPISGATNSTFSPGTNGNFAVEITTSTCTVISPCHSVLGIGVKELQSIAVSLYPNPSRKQFSVHSAQENIDRISVLSLTGAQVYLANINDKNHDITHNFVPGIYFVHITIKEQTKVMKLIIQE